MGPNKQRKKRKKKYKVWKACGWSGSMKRLKGDRNKRSHMKDGKDMWAEVRKTFV